MRIAVLDDYQNVAPQLADWKSLGKDAAVEFFQDHLDDEDALAKRLAPFDVLAIMRERTPFQRSLIERLPNLRLLVTTGQRNLSVDLKACTDRGITVCATGTSGSTTHELAWGLIIGLARDIAGQDRAIREGRWQTKITTNLHGRTLGILGLGHLGGKLAAIGAVFGMELIAWSQNLTAERAAACGATRVEKAELFERSDFLSVHLVLSERTRGIVGAAELNRMKPTAYVVNTARGPLIDNAALIEALHAGRIAGAGLDVYDREPLPPDDPLRTAPNTLLSPHVGYVTKDAYAAYFPAIVESIQKWREGAPVRVLASPA